MSHEEMLSYEPSNFREPGKYIVFLATYKVVIIYNKGLNLYECWIVKIFSKLTESQIKTWFSEALMGAERLV